MKSEIKTSTKLIIISVVLCGLLSGAQETDPFYLSLLEKGEKCFLDGDYKGAVKNLKIAYFGIRTNDDVKAKACVYLGLSHYYLKNSAEGKKYLREVEELLGENGVNTLNIDQGAKLDLIRLTKAFKSGKIVKAEGLQALPRVPAERATQNNFTNKKQIEQLIKANPRNTSFYYDLYSFHRFNNNFKEAKKAIENLVKNNPQDIYGYYMLGFVLYQERKFKDAVSHFVTFLQRAPTLNINPNNQIEIRALLILSRYYHGDREEARILIEESRELLQIDTIRALPISEKDKIVLRGLLEYPEE